MLLRFDCFQLPELILQAQPCEHVDDEKWMVLDNRQAANKNVFVALDLKNVRSEEKRGWQCI